MVKKVHKFDLTKSAVRASFRTLGRALADRLMDLFHHIRLQSKEGHFLTFVTEQCRKGTEDNSINEA